MSFTYKYPRPAVAVDCVVFSAHEKGLQVLLIQRGEAPQKGDWALPGGFVRMDETTEEAAKRELKEETGLKSTYLEQLYTFSDLERDPRERVISVAYYALVKPATVKGGSDAASADWWNLTEVPKMAFDHDKIFTTALERLRAKIRYQPVGFELLPTKFTLGQLQRLYETVLGRELDKRNFRRSFLKMAFLEELDEMETGVAHRPSRLYRFDRGAYRKLTKQGFNFEI